MLKDNFSEIQLISGQPVWFYLQDNGIKALDPVVMTLPTAVQVLTDPYLQVAIALLHMPLSTLKKSVSTIQFNTLWDFFLILKKIEPKNIYIMHFEYLFKLCFGADFVVHDFGWTIKNIALNEEWFNRIVDIILISTGLKKFHEQAIAQKPQWLIDKEAEIQRIKNQNKSTKDPHQEFEDLLKILISLNYELGYSFGELLHMNQFQIHTLSGFIPKMVKYDLAKRAVFSKQKIKYITDK